MKSYERLALLSITVLMIIILSYSLTSCSTENNNSDNLLPKVGQEVDMSKLYLGAWNTTFYFQTIAGNRIAIMRNSVTYKVKYLVIRDMVLVKAYEESEFNKLLAFASRDVLLGNNEISKNVSTPDEFLELMSKQFDYYSEIIGENIKAVPKNEERNNEER